MTDDRRSSESLEDRVHLTFAEINDSIQGWFNGSVPDTGEAFAEITATAHPDLSYVFPAGGVSERGSFWQSLRRAWGSNPDIRLATPRRHTRVLLEDRRSVVAEAIELQTGARAVDRPRHARRSTLIMVKDPAARHGLLLWRLHESIVPVDEEGTLDWSSIED